MRGEGLLYGLVFLGLLGAGAALIGPRLARSRVPAPRDEPAPRAPRPGARPAPPPPASPPTPRTPLADAAPMRERVVTVVLEGPSGALRGPVKPVVGAAARVVLSDEPARPHLELTLAGPDREVAFGAAGHQWVRRPAASLVDGERIALPISAPPVTVRVREPDGAPAPGVPVDVRPAAPVGVRRTDAGGTVVLDDLAPGLLVVLVGGLERAAPLVRLLAGADRDVRVVLEPAWTVGGRALGPDGGPLEGVRVEGFEARGASGRPVVTDAQGRFGWSGPAASVLSLRLSADGLAAESVEARPPATGALATDVGDVRLREAAVTLAGRVAGGGGRPGAHVVAEPQVAALLREVFGPECVLEQPRVAPLAADGSYALSGLPAGVALRLSLRGAGVPEDALLAPKAGERVTQDFAPTAGETLRARLSDGVTGRPAAGVRVLLSGEPLDGDVEQPGDLRAVTDAEGVLRVEGLLPGPRFLRAYLPGRRSLLQRIDLPQAGEAALAFEAAITDAARHVEGLVVDDLDQPLAGLTVRAAGVTATSAADGRFALDGVESLAKTVTVSASAEPGSGTLAQSHLTSLSGTATLEVAPGGPPLKVRVPRDQALALRAVDALTDLPMAFVHLVAVADDGRVLVDRGYAPVDGRIALAGLPRVGLTLSLFAPGRRFVRTLPGTELALAASAAGAVRDLGEVRLLRALTVEGKVVDAKGAPVAGARVAAMDAGWLGGLRRDPAPRRDLALRTTVSGADGAFRLEGLDPAKPASVVVWAPGFAPTRRRAVFALPDVGPIPAPSAPGAPGERATPPAAGEGAPPGPAPGEMSPAQRALARLTTKVDAKLRRGSHVSLFLTDEATQQPVHGAIVDLESARDGSDVLDLLQRGMLGAEAGSTEEWRWISEALLWEEREAGVYTLGPVEPGPYELLVEHPLFHPERRKIPVLDPSDPFAFEALEFDPAAKVDPNDPDLAAKVKRGPEMVSVYGGNRMRLPVELKPR